MKALDEASASAIASPPRLRLGHELDHRYVRQLEPTRRRDRVDRAGADVAGERAEHPLADARTWSDSISSGYRFAAWISVPVSGVSVTSTGADRVWLFALRALGLRRLDEVRRADPEVRSLGARDESLVEAR